MTPIATAADTMSTDRTHDFPVAAGMSAPRRERVADRYRADGLVSRDRESLPGILVIPLPHDPVVRRRGGLEGTAAILDGDRLGLPADDEVEFEVEQVMRPL